MEGGAGNVILALGREKRFGTEGKSRAGEEEEEEGRRAVGAQDSCEWGRGRNGK